jgi:uncharacterized protein (DUF58 family)
VATPTSARDATSDRGAEAIEAAHEGAVSPELMARVRRIEIRTRRLASALISGDYRSVFRGTGIEFADAREYIAGDDVRLIDWNVTARMGVPWVKEFVEERELTVVCAVDRSASQLVGTSPLGKLGAAAELTALLGFAAVQNQDRAGLLTFSDTIEEFVPPRRGQRHVLRLVRDVLAAGERHAAGLPGDGRHTDIGGAAEYLARVLRRRAVVFLISDFYDSGYESGLQTLARRHEVIALPLIDPLDEALPDIGLVELFDAERGGRILVDTSDRETRERYAGAARERAEARHQALLSTGVDEVEIHLEQDLVDPIATYFRRRASQR